MQRQFQIPPGVGLSGGAPRSHLINGYIRRLSAPVITAVDNTLLVPPEGVGPKPPGHWNMTRLYLPAFVLVDANTNPPANASLTLSMESEAGTIALASLLPIPLTPAPNPGQLHCFGATVLGSDLTNPVPIWCTQSIRFSYAVSFDADIDPAGAVYVGISCAVSVPDAVPPTLTFGIMGAADYEG